LREKKLRPAVNGILQRNGSGLERHRPLHLPSRRHAKVLAAWKRLVDLGAARHRARVLSDYGNMSSPTVLFVLERAVAGDCPSARRCSPWDPGFSASCVTLKRAA
jgi:alkylresorcinol/alkylpyrone synthase